MTTPACLLSSILCIFAVSRSRSFRGQAKDSPFAKRRSEWHVGNIESEDAPPVIHESSVIYWDDSFQRSILCMHHLAATEKIRIIFIAFIAQEERDFMEYGIKLMSRTEEIKMIMKRMRNFGAQSYHCHIMNQIKCSCSI